jgi:hypothetical protein
MRSQEGSAGLGNYIHYASQLLVGWKLSTPQQLPEPQLVQHAAEIVVHVDSPNYLFTVYR